jgi:Lon protease-like protein
VPVFPLAGALLLPYAHRPLNVFEPRYIEMVDAALGGDRLIGIIQPQDASEESPRGRAPLQKIGCLGRLTHFEENGEGRYFIILEGICRFDLVSELTVMSPYRQCAIDVSRFASDFDRGHGEEAVDRARFLKMMRDYAEFGNFELNWRGDRANWDRRSSQLLLHGLTLRCGRKAAPARGLDARGAGRGDHRHGRVRDGEQGRQGRILSIDVRPFRRCGRA